MSNWENNEEIQIFREYLQIPSVHPDVDYGPCVDFLKRQAESLKLPVTVCYPANKKCPVVIITWEGLEPKLPSIMLNSHMDVVPVDEDRWTHPPFAAEIDENGNIYARGAQDMKCCGTQYLAVIRALMKEGVRLRRTIHVTFVPDEEVGSALGMKAFVKSKEFETLNVGFELDETGASPYGTEVIVVFYAERTHCTIELICEGQGGHGCIMHENTAGEKLLYMMNKFMQLRKTEFQKLKDNRELKSGDVTAVNLTVLKGGLQSNIVPAEFRAIFDVRLAMDVDHDEFDKRVKQWCEEAGGGITIKHLIKDPKAPVTRTDSCNPFWLAFQNAVEKLDLRVEKWVCPGGTDARFIRELNIPALGFMPMPNTPLKLHDHDEFLNANIYLNGIEIYKQIITDIANVMETDSNAPEASMEVK